MRRQTTDSVLAYLTAIGRAHATSAPAPTYRPRHWYLVAPTAPTAESVAPQFGAVPDLGIVADGAAPTAPTAPDDGARSDISEPRSGSENQNRANRAVLKIRTFAEGPDGYWREVPRPRRVRGGDVIADTAPERIAYDGAPSSPIVARTWRRRHDAMRGDGETSGLVPDDVSVIFAVGTGVKRLPRRRELINDGGRARPVFHPMPGRPSRDMREGW
jgi:hypothetical protein